MFTHQKLLISFLSLLLVTAISDLVFTAGVSVLSGWVMLSVAEFGGLVFVFVLATISRTAIGLSVGALLAVFVGAVFGASMLGAATALVA